MSSSTNLLCSECGKSTSSFFIVIGEKSICIECKNNHKSVVKITDQPKRIFYRYHCLTHECKTYSVKNMMQRHSMKDCVIVKEETLGIIKPATQGGYNGDIGRIHYLGINEIVRLSINLKNYLRFLEIRQKIKYGRSDKKSYHMVRYYNKHLMFLIRKRMDVSKLDYHKNDDKIMKLKFILQEIARTTSKRYDGRKKAIEIGSGDYYTSLMGSFKSNAWEKKK